MSRGFSQNCRVSLSAAATVPVARPAVANGATLSGSLAVPATTGTPVALACAADPAAAAVIAAAASAVAAITL